VNGNPGTIYISTDGGANWTRATNAPNANWIDIASSADGKKLLAVANGGNVYSSTDWGNTWTTNNLPLNSSWYACASSANGTKLVVVSQKAGIYSSTDSGAHWTSNNAPFLIWQAVAMSADGNRMFATAWGGGIWTAQTTPAPQMNLTLANGNLAFSWIIPSTNFVLQQNLNLTTSNWVNVTNTPVPNLTNLQDEVRLPITNASAFYRLATQ
jgi:hypothetical protein